MNKDFNQEQYIKGMAVPVAKLIKDLAKLGIKFIPESTYAEENVCFVRGDTEATAKIVRMSKHSFYRFSGMTQLAEVPEKSQYILITPYTDDMWLQNVIKPIVIKLMEAL